MTPRILIAGYYGAGNAGDEVILTALLEALRRRDPAVELCVVSYDPESTSRMHGTRSLGWGDLEALADAVRWSTAVLVGGGGLWQDYWGFDPLDLLSGEPGGIGGYGTPVVLSFLLGRPCALLGAGVGPLHASASRDTVRDLATMATFVSVRDATSRDELIACGVDADHIHLGADLAFLADPQPARAGRSMAAPILGVSLRPWFFAGDPALWEAVIVGALRTWCGATNGQLTFVPFHESHRPVEDDRRLAARVAAAVGLPEQVRIVPPELTPGERMSTLGSADFVLGMRYHSLMAALAAGVPCIGLAYDPKVRHLMAEAGLEDHVLSLEGLEGAQLAERLTESAGHVCLPSSIEALRARAVDSLERALARASASEMGTPQLLSGFVIRQSGYLAAIEGTLRGRLGLPHIRRDRAEVVTGALDHALDRMASAEGELAATREDMGQARADASRAQARLSDVLSRAEAAERNERDAQRDLAAEHLRLEAEQARAIDASSQLERERARALDAFDQLATLRATAGVRLLDRYWRLMRRLAPEGSVARRLYRQAKETMRSHPRARLIAARGPRIGGGWPAGRTAPEPGDAEWYRAMDAHLATRLAASVLGTVFFLAPTRFEKNEGQRSYNLALGLSRRGWKVVFAYWRWRNDGERPQAVRPGDVLEVPLDVLLADPEEGLKKVPPGRGLVLLEFPVPASYRFLASANAHGHATVYDAVDDWQAFRDAGQAPWYDEAFERGLARSCDTVVAVSPTLARIVGGRCDRQVHLVPNAWSEDLLDGEARVSPERGTTTVGYFGHLTEAWFDWDLLLACARLRPDWRFHLIGYGGGWHTTRLPENVLYHGKLPRSALAGHAAGWDVALIPFRKGQVAAGADPIKIYEYLGLGLPVVGSGVHPPVGAEALVTIADTPSEIVRAIEAALSAPGDGPSERRAFAAANTWDRRIEALLRIVETAEPRASLKRRLFEALT